MQMATPVQQSVPSQAPRVESPPPIQQQQMSAQSQTRTHEEATQLVSKDLLKQEIINQIFSRPDLLASIISDWVIEENGLRQAAALIKIFGLDTAMNLMADVGSSEKSKILAFYNTVDNWDIQEELVSLNRLKTGLVARKYEQHLSSDGSDSSHFSFIKKLSDYQLFYLIKDEDARVIALLMTYLPAERSAKLIAQLSPKQKSQVAVEIGNINYINADILQAVTKRLAEKSLMIPKFELYPGSGINSLVSILDHLESKDETFVINTIKEFDPTLAQKIKKAYFVFEDLFGLTKEALKTIIKDVPKTALATSLVGGDENFIAKILSILPERKAEMLKFDIEKSKNAPQSEILKAKKEIVVKIREMIRTGEIDLEKALKPATESTALPKQQNGGATHAQAPQAPGGAQAMKPPPQAQAGAPKQAQTPPPPQVKVNPEVHAAPKQNVVK
jgi:flagellar motor switch protein FliG